MNQTREDKVAATTARMAELAAKFIERSGREIASLRAALAKLDTDATHASKVDALGDLRHLAHRMSGTGATLGFETLAEHAARIEKVAECPKGVLPDAAALSQINAGIESLAAELAHLEASDQRTPGT